MQHHLQRVVSDYAKKRQNKLTDIERRVIKTFTRRASISKNLGKKYKDDRTLGERIADRVAAFGGSWTFIFIFGGVLIAWVILNSYILARRGDAFDPYPYILLNLFLSMIAALQAPVIMMSQNRQAAKDREAAEHDYEVNLKSELEIRLLHEKLDELREARWAELVAIQQEQIEMLKQLVEDTTRRNAPSNVIDFTKKA